MRWTRHLIGVLILALYVAQVLGGRAVHHWQCLGDERSCCGEAHCRTASAQSQQHHTHHHCHCHHARDTGNEQQEHGEESPGNNRRHDSSTCWVCQVLGQSQDKPIELKTTISLAVTPVSVAVLLDFYPSRSRSGFHSRAPPAIQG